jgi:hypothetical protein
MHFQWSCPFCCVLDYSLLFIQFFSGVGSVCPWGCAGLSRGGWGNSMWHMALTCLEPVVAAGVKVVTAAVVVATHKFSQCNVVWRSFPWARGPGVKVLLSLVLYFCQVWLQHLSKVLESRSLCCLLQQPSHHLGSLLSFFYKFTFFFSFFKLHW